MPTRRDHVRDLLRQRVITGLHLGLLAPGGRLPSARSTAAEVGADYRLVVAAYRELEREGLVRVKPRSGISVAPGANQPAAALPRLAQRVIDVLVGEVVAGAPAPEFPEQVRRCLETLRLRAACFECNADQIHGLCAELERDYGLDAHGFDIADLAVEERLPIELRRADLLVTTSFHAAEVRGLAERLEKPWMAVSLDPGLRSELVRLLSRGPVYWVVTDPRFADKLRHIFQSEEGVENLRPVLAGQADAPEIPDDAPVVVMASARDRFPDSPLVRRGRQLRGFSKETARQILTFVVEKNLAALHGDASLAADAARADAAPLATP